ncbi:GntR family transcriptional regulator [Ruminococcaceae bacterium OttesenSCG-928-D13]|nr:GntR family transcriptional regulator [Ruminococcaceae bacterium OttesenSCG-928-D13]
MKKYDSLRDYVRRYISDGVNDGSFSPGDRISEQSVADRLGVSRTPAREALMQLHTEGLLEYTPRKGFAIKKVSEKEKGDIYEAVAALDAYTAVCALGQLAPQVMAALQECIEKIDVAIKYRNIQDYCTLQQSFHHIYRKACGNDVILQFLDTLESGLVPQVFTGEDQDSLFALYAELNNEHRHIVSLFEQRDPGDLFRYLTETHWASAKSGFTI